MIRAKAFFKLLRVFSCSEGGGVMPLIGVASFVLFGIIGLALDTGRAQLVHAKLLNSADAAGLAVGARLSTVDLNAEAAKFVKANFPLGYADATVTNVSAVASPDGNTITVTAAARMPTTLMRLLGVENVTVSARSEVTRSIAGLELALILDNTGSMLDGGKLGSLKAASEDLVDILFGTDNTAPNLYIGLVPFSQTVNIGPSRTSWMVNGSITSKNWGSSKWAGCVEARATNGRDVNDDPPSKQRFFVYYSPDLDHPDPQYAAYGYYNNWIRGSGTSTTYQIGNYGAWSLGPNAYCPVPITPMTESKSTIINAINSMEARGATFVNYGAVWGWRMLSPRWRGLWGGDMTKYKLPLDYRTPRMNKAAVIMTDGDNMIGDQIYTAYGYLKDKRLGNKTSDPMWKQEETARLELDKRLLQVCSSMKNSGIYIYTVVFGTATRQASKDLMRQCASQPDYFFDSPSSSDLTVAFKTIGDSLANLRVTK